MGGGHGHGIALDAHAGLDSPLHHWSPPLKMAGMLILIVACSLVQTIWLLPAILLLSLIIFALSTLPWRYLGARLKLPGYFIAALVIFLPFVAGTTIVATVGPFDIRQEGLVAALLVGVRFFSIFTLALVLFGSSSLLTSINAMRALKFPELLADMVLLTYRYLFEISDYFQTMRQAARMRGFGGDKFSLSNLSTLAALMGHMFVRSYEQSERVYRAMVLRGYGDRPPRRDLFVYNSADYIKLALAIIISILLVVAQFVLFS